MDINKYFNEHGQPYPIAHTHKVKEQIEELIPTERPYLKIARFNLKSQNALESFLENKGEAVFSIHHIVEPDYILQSGHGVRHEIKSENWVYVYYWNR